MLTPLVQSTPVGLNVGQTVLDWVPTDDVGSLGPVGGVDWKICISKLATGARQIVNISAVNDNTGTGNATTGDYNLYGGAIVGTVDVTITVDISGVGAAQQMRLLADTVSSGWIAYVHRLPLIGG